MHSLELADLQKLLLYRGYDNIESLIEFYEQLCHYTAEIEKSKFEKGVIRKVLIETYQAYYHIYNDILFPYYIPLIIIYSQQAPLPDSIAADIITRSKESPVTLIQSLIMREEGEVDKSKDYVKYQRKFNRTVIVDEYSEEGVERNKQILE